jgi:hypothetical protein
VRFAATGAGEGEGESEAFKKEVGWTGSALHKFLTFPFFVTVGQWGLQLYLYQMIAYFLFQVSAFFSEHGLHSRHPCAHGKISHDFIVMSICT